MLKIFLDNELTLMTMMKLKTVKLTNLDKFYKFLATFFKRVQCRGTAKQYLYETSTLS